MKQPRWLLVIVAVIPWLAALSCLTWLFFTRFPLSGVAEVSAKFDGTSPWFDPFLPGQRVTMSGVQSDGWVGQRIIGDPTYASARVPGVYDRVQVTLEARPSHQPLLEFGILRDAESFSFESHPLWSEALSQGWRQATYEGLQGYVRENRPDADLATTDLDHVLTWDATVPTPSLMDHGAVEKGYDVSLRGAHDFYIVPVDGKIDFQFAIQDVNRNRARTGKLVAFQLTQDDETILTDAIGTAGSQDTRPTHVYEKTISVTHAAPGVYKLSVMADDDVFIRSITTGARHWVIGPRLYLGDVVGYSTTTRSQPAVAWTNSRHLVVDTFHEEGRQTVSLGSASVTVSSTHQAFTLDRTAGEMSGVQRVTAPLGDVRLIGDGYFALDPSTFFFPKPRRLTDASDLQREGVVAVITPYVAPERTPDGWVRLTTDFDLTVPQSSLKFVLSAPGIDARHGAVDIRSVTLRYERPPLSWSEWWRSVRDELALAWHRL